MVKIFLSYTYNVLHLYYKAETGNTKATPCKHKSYVGIQNIKSHIMHSCLCF